MESNRLSEWFVPKFGSRNFRLSVGILFLPYTIMAISFTIGGYYLEILKNIQLHYELFILQLTNLTKKHF